MPVMPTVPIAPTCAGSSGVCSFGRGDGRWTRLPAVAQVPQPRELALDANRFVEREGLGDRVVVRGRVRADLLELADVSPLARAPRA